MISRPTTQQLLDDCVREVRDTIRPMVDDPAVVVRLEMLEQLLAACAVRSAHEIAWMADECDDLEAFVVDVATAHPGSAPVADALAAYRAEPTGSLHLEDRIRLYDLAGRAFSEALDLAMREGPPELAARARQLVVARKDREADTRPGFFFPGRK
jgi:hypothetical protein